MVPWKTMFLYQPRVFRFHVSLQECKKKRTFSAFSLLCLFPFRTYSVSSLPCLYVSSLYIVSSCLFSLLPPLLSTLLFLSLPSLQRLPFASLVSRSDVWQSIFKASPDSFLCQPLGGSVVRLTMTHQLMFNWENRTKLHIETSILVDLTHWPLEIDRIGPICDLTPCSKDPHRRVLQRSSGTHMEMENPPDFVHVQKWPSNWPCHPLPCCFEGVYWWECVHHSSTPWASNCRAAAAVLGACRDAPRA